MPVSNNPVNMQS